MLLALLLPAVYAREEFICEILQVFKETSSSLLAVHALIIRQVNTRRKLPERDFMMLFIFKFFPIIALSIKI
jgi:hypothetical protein